MKAEYEMTRNAWVRRTILGVRRGSCVKLRGSRGKVIFANSDVQAFLRHWEPGQMALGLDLGLFGQ